MVFSIPDFGAASADVAELFLSTSDPAADASSHQINIIARKILTKIQFKQLFYAGGNDNFTIASRYLHADSSSSIITSVWGINGGGGIYYNLNKLGGKDNDPLGVHMGYIYDNDETERVFFAQNDIVSYIEEDLNIPRNDWMLSAKMSIIDSLYNLCFSNSHYRYNCPAITGSRDWTDVVNALREYCFRNDITLTASDTVDLYINIRITNSNPNVKTCVIRIRYVVMVDAALAALCS